MPPSLSLRGFSDAATPAVRRCASCKRVFPVDFRLCPHDGTKLDGPQGAPSSPESILGEVLAGTFYVARLLGQGGMGRVYEAEHVRLPRKFAVKVIHEALAKSPDAIARFEREAQAAASIESEHVVEVLDIVHTLLGQPCIVAELLEGEDLASMLEREGKLPIPNAIAICRQACRGLAAAHAARVIHRDIKPSNLFLVRRPDESILVKLLDFGVAKMADGAGLTHTGAIVGTPAYMSPEQAYASASVDERADIYSLGAVLYRTITGSPPFDHSDPGAVLAKVLHEDPRRPRDLNRSIPEALDRLVQRAMARSPKDRPRTVLDFDKELAAFDQGALLERHALPVHVSSGSGYLGRLDPKLVEAADRILHEQNRRARHARPFAFGLALGAGVVVGAAVFLCSARALLMFVEREVLTDSEKLLLGVLSGICVLAATLGALRVLASRWRSALAIERLADGLRIAITLLLGSAGALLLTLRGYLLLGPPLPRPWLPGIDIGLVAVPTILGVLVFIRALRTAGRR